MKTQARSLYRQKISALLLPHRLVYSFAKVTLKTPSQH
jgi:hypothetical protein